MQGEFVSTIVVGVSLIVAAFMQATVFHMIDSISVMPDFTLVIVLMWSAVRGIGEGFLWAFATGILIDVLALDPLGGNALALLPVVLLGGMAGQRFFHSGLVIPVLATALATILHAIILVLVRSAGGDTIPLVSIGRLVFLQVILNCIIVPPVYLIASFGQRAPSVRHV